MKFLVSVICLLSFSVLAQKVEPENESETDPEIEAIFDADIPEPTIVISVIQCDATDAIVRICNYGNGIEGYSDDVVEVFGFTPTELVEAPPKEVVIIDPIVGDDFTSSPTPVDRMESELLGKYLVPKNISYETETNKIKPEQCVDFIFHNRLDDYTALRQENFSCDIPITANLGAPSGSGISHNIDLLSVDGERNETR